MAEELRKGLWAKRPEWGFAESPLVDYNQIIITLGGKKGPMAALNLNTGETLWWTTAFNDDALYSSPVVAVIGEVRQYIQLTMGVGSVSQPTMAACFGDNLLLPPGTSTPKTS